MAASMLTMAQALSCAFPPPEVVDLVTESNGKASIEAGEEIFKVTMLNDQKSRIRWEASKSRCVAMTHRRFVRGNTRRPRRGDPPVKKLPNKMELAFRGIKPNCDDTVILTYADVKTGKTLAKASLEVKVGKAGCGFGSNSMPVDPFAVADEDLPESEDEFW